MSIEQNRENRIVIRIGRHHLSFSTVTPTQVEAPIAYEPYVIKSGISLPANLREALKAADLPLTGIRKALVMVDAPVLLVPVELFEEEHIAEMYSHSFPQKEKDQLFFNVLPDLNAVAVFAISKDLNTVLSDNFQHLRISTILAPVWQHLHRRSFTGNRNKLYGYLHDQKLEIFSFRQNRFKFYNQFETSHAYDVLYFLLYVWKQQQLNPEYDELHLVGELPEQEWLVGELRKYLQNVYAINPSAEFNRAPATKIKGMPFDLMTLLTKGR